MCGYAVTMGSLHASKSIHALGCVPLLNFQTPTSRLQLVRDRFRDAASSKYQQGLRTLWTHRTTCYASPEGCKSRNSHRLLRLESMLSLLGRKLLHNMQDDIFVCGAEPENWYHKQLYTSQRLYFHDSTPALSRRPLFMRD
jgi:hypothetical protein